MMHIHGILTFQKNASLTVWPDGDADLIIFDDFAKRSSHHVIEPRSPASTYRTRSTRRSRLDFWPQLRRIGEGGVIRFV
ncbi:hypothetical protein [Burkholderia stagnalis]